MNTSPTPDAAENATENAAENADDEPAYTSLYFPQQSPVSINYLAQRRNVAVAPIEAPFSYLDLGCGNGVTLNTLAASRPDCSFYGVDSMPDHIANARHDAERGELANVEYLDVYFRDLPDHALPQFDYIALHGVYSWVNEDDRYNFRDIIANLLKPTGLVYVSYNTLPGSAVLAPLRDILRRYTSTLSGGLIERAREGMKYLKYLKDNDALYIRQNPIVGAAIEDMFRQDIRYIAHEYLADNHSALSVTDVADEMAEIDLKFCCSARLGSAYAQRTHLNKFQSILNSRPDEVEREAVKSVILNEKFRADIYCRAENVRDDRAEEAEFSTSVFGAAHLKTWRAKTPPRELSPDVRKLCEAAIPGVLNLQDLGERPELPQYPPDKLTDLVHHLVTDEHIRPFTTRAHAVPDIISGAFRLVKPFNHLSISTRLIQTGRCFLASEVLGDGIAIDLISGLFLSAVTTGTVADPVAFVDKTLKSTGREWRRKGVTVNDPDERRTLLTAEYETFQHDTLPLMIRLGVIEA